MELYRVYGYIIIVAFVIIVTVSIYCCQQNDNHESFNNTTLPQPLIFTKEYMPAGNCRAYTGCFYPSSNANPINLQTGKRFQFNNINNNKWCELSWRDCNAYQTCKNGKCIPKKYPS